MSPSFAKTLQNLTCGAAATLITLLLSLTFIQSTGVRPGAAGVASVSLGELPLRPGHTLFGQPEPAALVD